MKNIVLLPAVLLMSACQISIEEGEESSPLDWESLVAGTWQNCSELSSGSELYTTVQDGGYWQDTTEYFTDKDCKTPDASKAKDIYSGTYTLKNTLVLADGIKAVEVDWTYDQTDVFNNGVCYSLYSVVGNFLYFGDIYSDDIDCSTPEKRSVGLDYDFPLVKIANI
ncbi:hypothetical protein [Catenovulum maritimum]|uniref:Uncharacterized protein n=1 Tax=Catenovulum maritimum TaxID=1513271 RepID=A0A0J8GUT3_9ALTE|nr:hypothetical protein [Catenovulum maritimum]KMT66525.1 hypothetical protein XM47_03025 [Catenovulum maritimum]